MEFSSWLTPALVFTSQFGGIRSYGACAVRGQFLVLSSLALKGPDIIWRAGTMSIVAPQTVIIHAMVRLLSGAVISRIWKFRDPDGPVPSAGPDRLTAARSSARARGRPGP